MPDQPIPALKVCSKCREAKPATPEFFHRGSHKKDGFNSHCKDCVRKYREANKEQRFEYNKKYQQRNKERIKEEIYTEPTKTCPTCKETKPTTLEFYDRDSTTKDALSWRCRECRKEYRRNNKEKIAKYGKKHREENTEKIQEYMKIYREENREYLNQKAREYWAINREYIAEHRKTWKKWKPSDLEKLAEDRRKQARKRRALKLQNGYSPYTEAEVLNLYGTDCHLCNQPIDFDAPRATSKPGWETGLHIDHIIPLSKGGPDTLENVKPAHGLCNIKKHNKV
jgi:hypothetical protein